MITQPDIRPIRERGKRYELNKSYVYEDITVPKGFQYDGASVPRIFMFLIGFERDGIHRPAALVHDFLYQNKGYSGNNNQVVVYSRKQCDRIFFEIMKKVGVMHWHAILAYYAVRLGGKFSWGNK